MAEPIPQGENILYLDTSHASNEHHQTYIYTHEKRKVRVTREPNELFVKYEITEVGKIDTIVYKVDEKVHKFIDFAPKVSGKKIEEILVYFIRYNENPLYLSILTEDTYEKTENIYKRINYKLNKNGIWEEASDYALIFTDLNELAHKHDMLQYFEIDGSDKTHVRNNFPVEYTSLRALGDSAGDFKIYKHSSKSDVNITSLFLYRNKLLKNLIVTHKRVYEVDVYYDRNDHKNRLPLLIVIHKREDGKEYYTNEGGNYLWKWEQSFPAEGDNVELIKRTLKEKKQQLMGKIVELEIEDYYEHLYETQTHFQGLDIFIQHHKELGYRSIKYTDKNRRFSISSLRYEGHPVVFPDLPLYSILELYIFHHGNGTYPMFICAVYERKRDNIFVWYRLSKSNKNEYKICYFLNEDPLFFKELKPMIKVIETEIYIVNIDISKSILDSYAAGRKKLTLIDDHNFYVWYQKSHSTHNRYVITPAFSNYFTVNSIIMYGKVIPTEKFESVKEIHVFEHSNYHHYKVCIVTAKYNYVLEYDDITLHWLELRRNTNLGPEWKLVGRPDIEKSPDDFDNAYNISVLLDERISFYKDGDKVFYQKPKNVTEAENLKIVYGNRAEVSYKKGDKWPPIEPEHTVNGSGNLYSISEFDPNKKVITGITTDLPGEEGGITPLVGGLIGSGAGVGIVGVTTGYVLYSHMGTITSALTSIFH